MRSGHLAQPTGGDVEDDPRTLSTCRMKGDVRTRASDWRYQDDVARAEQALADRQRLNLVLGDDPARIADDPGLALVQPEQAP